MGDIINRDIPYTYAVYAESLTARETLMLESIYHVEPKNFVLVKHSRECIVLNKALGGKLKEVEEIINKVMQSKYLPEKLLDRFSELTDEQSSDILMEYYFDWRDELRKRELHRKAMSMLKSAKSLRISWKVRHNKKIIRELFNIGGDYQQGAENTFMYGYLLGVQSQKGITE